LPSPGGEIRGKDISGENCKREEVWAMELRDLSTKDRLLAIPIQGESGDCARGREKYFDPLAQSESQKRDIMGRTVENKKTAVSV